MYQTSLTTENWNIVGLGETEEESQKVVLDVIKHDFGYDLSFNDIFERYGAYTNKVNKLIMWTNNCVSKDDKINI